MSRLGPSATRFSCLTIRTILQTSYKVDSLAARLTQQCLRPYSILSLRHQQRSNLFERGQQKHSICRGQHSIFDHPAGIRTYASRNIVTKYEDLPPHYREEDGLDFRSRPLTKKETIQIFGKIMDDRSANKMLRALHGSRVSGTLEDPSRDIHNLYAAKAIDIGLAWLRENVPVDEIRCAGLRAESELAKMQEDVVFDPEILGIYKRSPKEMLPNSQGGENIYGESGLDVIRKQNEENFAKRQAEKEQLWKRQAEEIRQNTGTLMTAQPKQGVELRRPGENPKLKYYLERANVLPDKPPEMTAFQRLYPSGIVLIATLIGMYVFAEVYTPPKTSTRLFPDMPSSAATVMGIIAINTIATLFWRFPPAFRMLNKYFIIVPGYPFALSILGNFFSHQSLPHLAMNMVFLWFIGTKLHEETGRAGFLALYISCGVLASFGTLTAFVLRNNFATSSLGASGALCGILACYLLLNSSAKIQVFGFPPESWPSISCVTLLCFMIGWDVIGLRRGVKAIDHWAHLSGYTAGIALTPIARAKTQKRKEMEMDRRKNVSLIQRLKEGNL